MTFRRKLRATLRPVGLKIGRPSVLSLLVAAMIVLLPVLAVLQYRWLGQLSDAEGERLQRNLRSATADFTADFTQIVEVTTLVQKLESSGKVYFKRPGRMRCSPRSFW